LGRSVVAVKQRRVHKGLPPVELKCRPWTPTKDKLLGTKPDAQIASVLGRTRGAVQNRRFMLGILPMRADGAKLWTAEEVLQLGTGPDAEIARRLNRSKNSVQLKREKLGIPCFASS